VADITNLFAEYRAVLAMLADAAREASDPSLSAEQRLERARLMRPLRQRYDGVLAEIDRLIGAT
jgi:hypothetical protein